jgi:hypothetical protein
MSSSHVKFGDSQPPSNRERMFLDFIFSTTKAEITKVEEQFMELQHQVRVIPRDA